MQPGLCQSLGATNSLARPLENGEEQQAGTLCSRFWNRDPLIEGGAAGSATPDRRAQTIHVRANQFRSVNAGRSLNESML